ncbi:MAG: hypothetical protein HY356_02490 [Gammaproteobacteria bacterium]|nr:hypothetical protein [Gammaproteobacteria bacterium]
MEEINISMLHNEKESFYSDYLKNMENICESDPRNKLFSEYGLENHHKSISRYILKKTVPEDVAIQFETSKNLYLYAWFVYRFYPVAELHAFTCLELALKERYRDEFKDIGKDVEWLGLKKLLMHAIKQGHIKNEGFQVWHESAQRRARFRHEIEMMKEMEDKGLTEMIVNDSEFEIQGVDRNMDYIKVLQETLPAIRNHYAHGSKTLHNQVLGTIQIVSEIINQIYE